MGRKKDLVIVEGASGVSQISSGLSSEVSQAEILTIVAARAEKMYDEKIKLCKTRLDSANQKLAELQSKSQSHEFFSEVLGSVAEDSDIYQKLLAVKAMMQPATLLGCEVVMYVDAASTEGNHQPSSPGQSASRIEIAVVLLDVAQSQYIAERYKCSGKKIAYFDMNIRAIIRRHLPPMTSANILIDREQSKCLADLLDAVKATNDEIAAAAKERDLWIAKKQSMPSLERQYMAKIAETKLSKTEAGKEILAKLTSTLDQDILALI